MGSDHFCPIGPREAIQFVSVSTFSVVEVGNAQRKTDRHDGYTGVWVCVEATVLFARFRLLLLRSGRQKWYVLCSYLALDCKKQISCLILMSTKYSAS